MRSGCVPCLAKKGMALTPRFCACTDASQTRANVTLELSCTVCKYVQFFHEFPMAKALQVNDMCKKTLC